jgi:hypothetical protein
LSSSRGFLASSAAHEPIVDASQLSNNERSELLNAAAAAGMEAQWHLGNWEDKDFYLQYMNDQSHEKSFFSAIFALTQNKFDDAYEFINRCADALGTRLATLSNESYQRCYSVLVGIQKLFALIDVVLYKKSVEMQHT